MWLNILLGLGGLSLMVWVCRFLVVFVVLVFILVKSCVEVLCFLRKVCMWMIGL